MKKSEGIRLQKYLALCGIASRRKAEQLILEGKASINGKIVKQLGIKVFQGDWVEFNGKPIRPEERKVYIMLNKPARYVTTVKDQFSRKTVMELLENVKERVFPVGRLDYHTSGLLLFTNDGNFAYRYMHPKYEVKKTYLVKIQGFLDDENVKKIQDGVVIDGYRTQPAQVKVKKTTKSNMWLEITIYEGKNRQIRKMCEAIGHPVLKLKRIAEGSLRLGSLKEGEWRYLTKKEVDKIKGDINLWK